MANATHVLIVVQNLPVPLDRRVWMECRALRSAGYDVSVICPKGPGDAARETIEGVRIHRYRPAPVADGALGYLVEFVYCWLRTAWLSASVWRHRPFDVLQACNPPDTYWALARLWRRRGVLFVYDQHDLNPELFLSRFGQPTGLGGRLELAGLRWLERRTYRTADHVISTNCSYERIALHRGELGEDAVTVVRSGPDTSVMRPVRVPAGSPPPTRHRVAYLGIMGPQDDVHLVLELMHELVHVRGRDDVEAVLMGFGDCYDDLVRRSSELGLDDVVTFTGRVGPEVIAEQLSAATVGVCPDRKTPLNDLSTMNKTMEYMAYALPSVAFDLMETRVSGEDSCLYVPSGDVGALADAVAALLDDPELRCTMARRARRRVSGVLDWRPQAVAYVGVFDRLTGTEADRDAGLSAPTGLPGLAGLAGQAGLDYVDVDDDEELRRFVLDRGPRAAARHRLGV
ncbi:glycosyltransferase family 4 protein [Nocardioides pantholopis]|uniref:glycosyltransferase family 4 protein n=1 Tax=Nocardioides pantholopis TaxID=2483798 RepID=UPI000F07CE94|nr:glycosyltransferase family 4 protein [Nocardioides pantholopis]